MRRPRFQNWARSELLKASGLKTFSLRKIASIAQSERSETLIPILFLYAHESGRLNRLLTFIYDPELLAEYQTIEHNLGQRSIERLALRNTPMMSLPESYREVFALYERAYHVPELVEQEKQALQQAARESMLRLGTSPAEIARALKLDPSNLHAYLTSGDTHRFSLEKARQITSYLDTF